MKRTLFALAVPLAGALVTAIPANAVEISPYISGKIGFEVFSVKADIPGAERTSYPDFTYGGAIGAKIETSALNLRAEFEYSYFSTSEDRSDYDFFTSTYYDAEYTLNASSYMANLYVDFLSEYRIKPYIGVGLGMLSVADKETGPDAYEYSDSAFSYAAHAGFWFNITDGLAMDFAVHYQGASIENVEILNMSATTGLRYTF